MLDSKTNYYKNCLKATLLESKTIYMEKNKLDIDRIKENHKEFIKNKSTLKIQQKFKIERHNVFIDEINKIALS